MTDQYYPIPDSPVYNPNIRQIQNGDYVDAEQVLGPVLQQMIENQAADHFSKADLEDTRVPLKQLPPFNKRDNCFIIGTSVTGWTKDNCDYLCDGVNDEEEINAAISEINIKKRWGSALRFLPGEYNISADVILSPYTNIYGEVKQIGTNLSGTSFNIDPGAKFKTTGTQLIYGICKTRYEGDFIVEGVGVDFAWCHINHLTGNLYSTRFINCNLCNSQFLVCNNCLFSNIWSGIEVRHGSFNTFSNIYESKGGGGCIEAYSINHSVFIGNRSIATDQIGMFLSECNDNVVIGNNLLGCSQNSFGGIWLRNSSRNLIEGNSAFNGGGLPTDYVDTSFTIKLTGNCNNNMVSNNLILGKNYIVEGTGNTFVNNKYN